MPPRDALKLFATALLALEQKGVPDPGRRLAMLRGWQTATLVVKNGELTAEPTSLRSGPSPRLAPSISSICPA